MLKMSRYNFSLEAKDGHLLLYNSRLGSFCAVPLKQKKEVISALDSEGKNCSSEIKKELIKGGFLVKKEEDEFKEISNIHHKFKEDNQVMILTMLASEACNFRCPYCFVYQRRGFNMKDWVYDAVLKLIRNSITNNFKLKINWFGGEPTLAHKQILSFSKQLNRMASDEGFKELKYSMVTNGYLLSIEKFQQYIDLGLDSFQITLDGDARIHNQTRFLVNGKGTYQVIWNNLLDIAQTDLNFEMAIRVNFIRGKEKEINNFIDRYNGTFGKDKRFHLYFRPVYDFESKTNNIGSMKESICSLEEGVYQQMDYNILMATKNGELRKEMLLSNPIPTPIPAWCDTEKRNFWVIGADGLLFKCDSYVGHADKASGKLSKDGIVKHFINSYDWNKSVYRTQNTKCMECKLLPICQGGCPRFRRENKFGCYLTENMVEEAMLKTHNYYLNQEKMRV